MVCRDGRQACQIHVNVCLRGKVTVFPNDIFLLCGSTTGKELYDYIEEHCQIRAGTFKLFLLSAGNLFDLSEMKDKTMSEIGVDFSYDCETHEAKHTLLVGSPKDTLSQKRSEYGLTVPSSNNSTALTEDEYSAMFPEANKPQPRVESCVKFRDFDKPETNVCTEDEYSAMFPDANKLEPKVECCVRFRDFDKPETKVECSAKYQDFNKPETNVCTEEEYSVKFQDFNKSETNYVGLVNQAMTCYLNSLLQALYMTPEFRNALYNWEYVDGSEKDEANSIPYQLQKLFLNLQTSTKSAVETTSLTKSFGWDSTEAWQQHDIQELCRVMFDALEQKFKNTEQADLINRLYEGKMIDYVKCLECCTVKSREDTFLDIPLPVRPFGSNVAYNSVEEAIRAFVQHETLEGNNQYHCEKCNKKCDAHKGLKFTKFPYLLTLHLKRFDFDFKTFHRIKLNDKVTFPDILNLNSFISSRTNQESPCGEEDIGLGVKCDDSSTTDSGTLDDDCPPCENNLSNSNHSTTHDQDDDEGIDMNNGPSTSNYNTHNHENEKNHGNCSAKGPYIYELFSIMIHSGSASGGHYYAHIKDFRTQEWLSFNDQSVTQITHDDIKKTYGGGPTRPYYSGAYSSSTNAYMLMYRQIDPARNALPMQAQDFPPHIQELLKKMKECDDKKSYKKQLSIPSVTVYCQHPVEGQLVNIKVFKLREDTWAEITELAYIKFGLGKLVELDQCRLVLYDARSDLIVGSCEGKEQETVASIWKKKSRLSLLLEIRNKDEEFKSYLPCDIVTNVYIIDVPKKEVIDGPINVRALLTQTVREYKQMIGNITDIDPKQMKLVIKVSSFPTVIEKDDSELQAEGFHNWAKVFVSVVSDEDFKSYIEWTLLEIIGNLDNVISLHIQLPDTSKEVLEEMNIQSLEECWKEKEMEKEMEKEKEKEKNKELEKEEEKEKEKEKEAEKEKEKETCVSNSPSKLSVSDPPLDSPKCNDTAKGEKSNDDVPSDEVTKKAHSLHTKHAKNISPQLAETEEWNTPEQSNSEDSSLSDSDKTLVGDAPEKDEFEVSVVHPLFEKYLYFSHKVDRASNRELEDSDDEEHMKFYFKATPYVMCNQKMLKVLVDKRMCLATLKEDLEPYVGVPAKYFRVFRLSDDSFSTECSSLFEQLTSFKDGERLNLKLGRALRKREFKIKLYQFFIDSPEPFKFLCEWIVSKGMTVGQVKKEILAGIKRKYDIDIPYERCRLRKKFFKMASTVFLDDQKLCGIQSFYSQIEVIIQELPGKETVTDSDQVVLFVRRWSPAKMQLEQCQEVVMDGQTLKELRTKISAISDIPGEYIEIAKAKQDSFPFEMSVLRIQDDLEWNEYMCDMTSVNIKDGYVFLYRDKRENLKILTSEEEKEIAAKETLRLIPPFSSTSGYSARKEKALIIYLGSK